MSTLNTSPIQNSNSILIDEPEPKKIDTKRLKYLGFSNSGDTTFYLFKDSYYDDVFKIALGNTNRGFSLVSIDDNTFTITKEDEIYKVKKE